MQAWSRIEESDELEEQDAAVEKLARSMALLAGVSWDRLDHYPGYERGRWRDEARAMLRSLQVVPSE